MAKAHNLPPLSFDSSHSAQARFFGMPFEVGFHYVEGTGAGMLKMICPNDLDDELPKTDCQACRNGLYRATRMVTVAWDVNANRWCLYMAPAGTFWNIHTKCSVEGVDPKMVEDGQGPDVLLTKVGKTTEVFAMPETLGQPRGEPVVYKDEGGEWAQGKFPPRPSPVISRVLKGIYNNSIWRFSKDIAEARLKNPPKGAARDDFFDEPPTPRPAATPAPTGLNFRLLRDIPLPPRQPEPPAQEGPIKAKPKIAPKEPPKMPDIAEDRFDII